MLLEYFEVGLDGIKRRVKFEQSVLNDLGLSKTQTKTIDPKD